MAERDAGLPRHLQLAGAAVRVFADDGRLDVAELDYLLAVAMRDGVLDADERSLLTTLFEQLRVEELPPETAARLAEVRGFYGI